MKRRIYYSLKNDLTTSTFNKEVNCLLIQKGNKFQSNKFN